MQGDIRPPIGDIADHVTSESAAVPTAYPWQEKSTGSLRNILSRKNPEAKDGVRAV